MARPDITTLSAAETRLRRLPGWVTLACVLMVLFYALAELWLLLSPPTFRAEVKLLHTTSSIAASPNLTRSIREDLESEPFLDALSRELASPNEDPADLVRTHIKTTLFDWFERAGLSEEPLRKLGIEPVDLALTSKEQVEKSLRDRLNVTVDRAPASAVGVITLSAKAGTAAGSQELANAAAHLLIEQAERAATLDNQATKKVPDETGADRSDTTTNQFIVALPDPAQTTAPANEESAAPANTRLAWFENDLITKREQLSQAERAVDDFLAKAGAPSAELLGARQMRLEAVKATLGQRQETRNRLENRLSAFDALIAKRDTDELALQPEVTETAGTAETRLGYIEAREEVETLSDSLGAEHPSMVAATQALTQATSDFLSQINRLVAQLRADLASADRSVQDLLREASALEAIIEETQARFVDLRTLDRARNEAERDFNQAFAALEAARQTAAAQTSQAAAPPVPQGPTQFVVNIPQATIAVPTQAAPSAPTYQLLERAALPSRAETVSPNLIRALGGGAGLVLSLVLFGLANGRSDRLTTSAALEEATGLPVLAVIPRPNAANAISAKKKRKSRKTKTSHEAAQPSQWLDAITDVSDALRVGSPDAKSTSVAVFGTVAPEIRAGFVVDLAVAASSDGLEVAVIDCDPRLRLTSQAFGEQRAGDLTSLLLGRKDPDMPSGETSLVGLWLFTLGSMASLGLKRLKPESVAAQLSAKLSRPGLILMDVPRPDKQPGSRPVARLAETAVVLVDAKQARKRDLRSLIFYMQRAGAEIAGLVVVQS